MEGDIHKISYKSTPFYRRLKYQLNPKPIVSAWNGLGASANPGRATGCLKYTAAHTF